MVISWVSSFPQKEQMLTIADEGARGWEVVNQKLTIADEEERGGRPNADKC